MVGRAIRELEGNIHHNGSLPAKMTYPGLNCTEPASFFPVKLQLNTSSEPDNDALKQARKAPPRHPSQRRAAAPTGGGWTDGPSPWHAGAGRRSS